MDIWNKIKSKVNEHGYMSGVDRMTNRIKETGEVFTPTDLVIEMIQKLLDNDPNCLGPGKTVLEPACGDGQFLVAIKWLKIMHYNMLESDALNDLYGIDIMEDNVALCRKRLGGGHIFHDDMLNPTNKELRAILGYTEPASLEDFFA